MTALPSLVPCAASGANGSTVAPHPTFAFHVIIEAGDQHQEHVVAGIALAEAAVTAQGRTPPGGRVVRMAELGELLAQPDRVVKEERPAPADLQPEAPVAALVAPSLRDAPRGTRREQLLAVLRQHGGPLHLDVVAVALKIKRGHADEIARQAVKAGLVRRAGSRTGKIELAKAAVVETPVEEPAPDVSPAPASEESKRSASPTRVDRLVTFLETRKGAVHATEIAETLATTRGNADSAMRAGIRAGLVRRVGSRTGLVELVATADPSEPVAEVSAPVAEPVEVPAEPQGQTRIEQLVALLQDRGDPVHVRDIRAALRIKPANVHNIVAAAVKAGLVTRVGNRTGLVELTAAVSAPAGPATPEGGESAAEPARLVPAQIDGIRRHVYGALVELEVFATAKEVAGVLGCRPREAGNALTLLVDGGLAERADGDRAAGKPRRYRALPN